MFKFKFKGDKDWDDYQDCVTYPTVKLANEEIKRAKNNPSHHVGR